MKRKGNRIQTNSKESERFPIQESHTSQEDLLGYISFEGQSFIIDS